MQNAWFFLSAAGDSRWLLPMTLVLLCALPSSRARLKWRWLTAICSTAAVTLASKLAFMGWGIGIERLHFTGFSGHAAMSSVAYPVIGLMLGGASRHGRAIGLLSGCALAIAIAWSRIPLQAHSLSEIFAGLTLGLVASAWTLRADTHPQRPAAAAVLAAAVIGLVLPLSLPHLPTHQLVIALAKALSGRTEVVESF